MARIRRRAAALTRHRHSRSGTDSCGSRKAAKIAKISKIAKGLGAANGNGMHREARENLGLNFASCGAHFLRRERPLSERPQSLSLGDLVSLSLGDLGRASGSRLRRQNGVRTRTRFFVSASRSRSRSGAGVGQQRAWDWAKPGGGGHRARCRRCQGLAGISLEGESTLLQ
jgi:hypothetical protein